MIYTVTFNPSLDYVVRVSEFEPGKLHRSQSEELFVGGKGINVSTVLNTLDVASVALGFIAGFTGNEIERRLYELGLSSDFIPLKKGVSRINIKLKTDEYTETEINGQGPDIDEMVLKQLYGKLTRLQVGDFLVLSGSVPKSLPNANRTYSDICIRMQKSGVRLIVDAEGELLSNTLCSKPFLIKPNLFELERLFGKTLIQDKNIIDCAKKLKEQGAANVLVSLAGDGAILVDELGNVHRQAAPRGEVKNSVGAGDALIAGFLSVLVKAGCNGKKEYQAEDYKAALAMGVATGSAAAFSMGLPMKKQIDDVLMQMSAL
jgi:1-phosphofructokinase